MYCLKCASAIKNNYNYCDMCNDVCDPDDLTSDCNIGLNVSVDRLDFIEKSVMLCEKRLTLDKMKNEAYGCAFEKKPMSEKNIWT